MPEVQKNEAQALAIAHADGPLQVLAGPGSGKTYLTIRRIRHLICHHGISPDKILVITFTKAAASEMEQRFRSLTEHRFPQVRFGTFHAVYYSILKQSRRPGERLVLVSQADQKKYLSHIQKFFSLESFSTETEQALLQRISARKNDITCTMKLEAEIEAVFPQIYAEYCRLMEEEGKLDFDDMICQCGRMLEEQPELLAGWQSAFSHILVDEFQDISMLQYRIICKLAEPERNLFVVGDDDQSIYGFRGAGPGIMQQFLKDYPEAEQLTLSINYRCPRRIVHAAGIVIRENTQRFPKQILAEKDGGTLILKQFADREEEAAYLADQLGRILPEAQGETAVIVRTNAQTARLAPLLHRQQLSFFRKEVSGDLFCHPVAEDLLGYLQFARDVLWKGCGERRDLLRIMNRPSRFLHRDALRNGACDELSLKRYYQGNPYMQETVEEFFCQLRRLASFRPYLGIQYVRKAMGYDQYLSEGRREEVKDCLETADRIQKTAAACDTLEEWKQVMAEESRRYREKEAEKQKKKSHEGSGIHLITMHASKGLEYDTVYLPSISTGYVPNPRAVGSDGLEEERRLFYVAMTRAKKRLEILYHQEPSPFLHQLLSAAAHRKYPFSDE